MVSAGMTEMCCIHCLSFWPLRHPCESEIQYCTGRIWEIASDERVVIGFPVNENDAIGTGADDIGADDAEFIAKFRFDEDLAMVFDGAFGAEVISQSENSLHIRRLSV